MPVARPHEGKFDLGAYEFRKDGSGGGAGGGGNSGTGGGDEMIGETGCQSETIVLTAWRDGVNRPSIFMKIKIIGSDFHGTLSP